MSIMETKPADIKHLHNHDVQVSDDGGTVRLTNAQLEAWKAHYNRQLSFATSRKERCEKLMRRHCSKKWSPEKTARMVRRLTRAATEMRQANAVLHELHSAVPLEQKDALSVETIDVPKE